MTDRRLHFDFSSITVPWEAAPDPGSQEPIVVQPDPEDMPQVPDGAGADEPIVAVRHDRVHVLSAYWRAGWTDSHPGAWLRERAAARLVSAADTLPDGWGLAVFDAWRSTRLQYAIFKEAYADPALPPGFVTEPSVDPATPPPHTTGGTVDVTLTWGGVPLALGSNFDQFDDFAHLHAFESEDSALRNMRRLLFHAMDGAGFVGYAQEWWHYEWGTRRWAAVRGREPMYGPVRPYDTPVSG